MVSACCLKRRSGEKSLWVARVAASGVGGIVMSATEEPCLKLATEVADKGAAAAVSHASPPPRSAAVGAGARADLSLKWTSSMKGSREVGRPALLLLPPAVEDAPPPTLRLLPQER